MASDSVMAGRVKATNPVLLIFLLIPVSCENNMAVNPGSDNPAKVISETTHVTATILTMGDFSDPIGREACTNCSVAERW